METKVRSRPNPSGRQTVRTKSVRSGVKSALRGLGFELSRHPRYLSHDWLLRSVMSEAAADLVIGVGAHWGSFVRAVRRLGYNGDVVCIEPVASSFERLSEVVADDRRCSVHQLALGSRSSELDMFVHPDQSWLNSARRLNAFGQAHFNTLDSSLERVRVERLDDFLESLELNLAHRRASLNVDTQGLDFDVLEGSAAALDHVVVLQVEVSARAIYEGTATLGEQLDRALSMGFDIVNLAPVARAGVRTLEFDALLLRTDLWQQQHST